MIQKDRSDAGSVVILLIVPGCAEINYKNDCKVRILIERPFGTVNHPYGTTFFVLSMFCVSAIRRALVIIS